MPYPTRPSSRGACCASNPNPNPNPSLNPNPNPNPNSSPNPNPNLSPNPNPKPNLNPRRVLPFFGLPSFAAFAKELHAYGFRRVPEQAG